MIIRRLLCSCSARCFSTSLSEICFTRGRASQKRAKLVVKSLISFILIIGIMLSFSVSASASSSRVYNIKDDFQLELSNETGDTLTGNRISSRISQVNGVTYYQIYPRSASDQAIFYSHTVRIITALKLENLSLKTEYNIKFSFFTSQNYSLVVFLNPGNGGESIVLFGQDAKNNEIIDCNINFTLSELGLSSNNNLELGIMVIQNAEILGMSYYNFTDIVLTDLDDNSQFFDGIWGTIKHIFIAIVGGECSDGDFQSVGLFGKLAEGFSALGNKVSQLFTDFKNSWTAGINALKDKIESIQQWFVELGENIIEGIKSLFIPEDGYFESKLDLFLETYEDHFGIFAQVTTYFIKAIQKVDSILSDQYSFVFPELYITIQGQKYVFSEQHTVDIQQWLASGTWSANLYEMYRVCASAILVFCVLKYAHKVEGVILGTSETFVNEVL